VSDEAIVEALRARDPRAFELLVRRQTSPLLATATRILRNQEDASDAVQDAFIAAFKAVDRFDGNSQVSTWLHRILINVCLMRLRSRRRKPEESIDALLPSFLPDGHHVESFVDWPENVHAVIEQREMRDAVRHAIDRLPESYRTALLLRDIEELDLREVAHALDISPNAAKLRVHRARQALRTILSTQLQGLWR